MHGVTIDSLRSGVDFVGPELGKGVVPRGRRLREERSGTCLVGLGFEW